MRKEERRICSAEVKNDEEKDIGERDETDASDFYVKYMLMRAGGPTANVGD